MNCEDLSITMTGYTEGSIQFPKLRVKTIIWCSDSYRRHPWYDFVMIKNGNCIVPGKVVGIIKRASYRKFVIQQCAAVTHDFDGPSKLLESFFLAFTLGGLCDI